MKKDKKYKYIIYFLITIAFLFYLNYALYIKQDLSKLEVSLKDLLANIENIITPKVKVDYKNINDVINNDILNELEELKKTLELNNTTNYKLENASILNRNVDTYFNEITINKGKKNGIDKNMIAINKDGIIGKVKYVTENTSTIKLITSNEIKISIQINEINAILNGYEDGYLIANPIDNNKDIEIGSEVITNGLGKVFPKGIKLGIVDKVIYKDNDINKTIFIKSDIDYEDIKYVSIIIGDKK